MPRCIVKCPDRPSKEDLNQGMRKRIYGIQVITPIFGGGIKAGENDS